jgi:hypothetical protein
MKSPALPLRTSGRCCSDLRLDQLLCGELDDGDAHALRVHLESSPRCAARLAELRADRDTFVTAPPPLRVIDGGMQVATAPPANKKAPSLRGQLLALTPVLAAAAGLFIALRGPAIADVSVDPVVGADLVRAKGAAPQVLVHGKRGDVVRPLGTGDVVFAGDLLRIDVGTSGPGHVGVVGVDHDGIAAWIPADGETITVAGGAPTPLPTAVALDEAPTAGSLKIVVWACEAPIAMATLVTATSTQTVPTGCARETLSLQRAGGAATP